MPNKGEVRAEAKEDKWIEGSFRVDVFIGDKDVGSLGFWDEAGTSSLTKKEASLLCAKINQPDAIAVVEEMEKEGETKKDFWSEDEMMGYIKALSELKRRLTGK